MPKLAVKEARVDATRAKARIRYARDLARRVQIHDAPIAATPVSGGIA